MNKLNLGNINLDRLNLDNLNFDKVSDIVKTIKAQEEASLAKANDVLNAVKVGEILKKKDEIEREEKKRSKIWIIVGIIVFIVVFAAALYGLYCYFTPDYLEDFDDEIDDEEEDEFEDDFFEDEEGNSDQN